MVVVMRKPVVFLDRDGTLNVEKGYIHNVDDLHLIEGAAESVRRLNHAGVVTILVTNQTGAARGFYPEEHIVALNNRLLELLRKEGAHLDKVYYCPHSPEGSVEALICVCNCRKPAPGMVEQAFNEWPELDRNLAFVVGDKASDVELAQNCGVKGILVLTGYGEKVMKGEYQWKVEPDFEAPSINEAVDWILEMVKKTGSGQEAHTK